MTDDDSSFGDGSIDVGHFFELTQMVVPGSSLFNDEGSDHMIRIAFSDKGKCIGEVGFGFAYALIQATGWRGLKAHAPPWGMGKG